jgi:hypothetical protein
MVYTLTSKYNLRRVPKLSNLHIIALFFVSDLRAIILQTESLSNAVVCCIDFHIPIKFCFSLLKVQTCKLFPQRKAEKIIHWANLPYLFCIC